MLSVASNIVFTPNITQNAERKHRTQNTNTAHFRTSLWSKFEMAEIMLDKNKGHLKKFTALRFFNIQGFVRDINM